MSLPKQKMLLHATFRLLVQSHFMATLQGPMFFVFFQSETVVISHQQKLLKPPITQSVPFRGKHQST